MLNYQRVDDLPLISIAFFFQTLRFPEATSGYKWEHRTDFWGLSIWVIHGLSMGYRLNFPQKSHGKIPWDPPRFHRLRAD